MEQNRDHHLATGDAFPTGMRATGSRSYAVDDVFVPHRQRAIVTKTPCELAFAPSR